jgi:hypothetical protein
MAAPTYTTDLSTFDLCENDGGTFGEFTGMTDGGSPDDTDTEDVIQGSYLTSAECKLKVSELQSIYADYGSGVTIPTDGAIFIWFKFDAGGILNTYDNGGVRIVVGQAATQWEAWKAGGVDKTPNPYGGWFNYAINPTARTYDYIDSGTTGTGTTYRFAGMACTLTAAGPTKGQPFKIDGLRYGRGSIILEYGSSGDGYATFADAAAKNDANDATDGYNRWGLFQAYGGGYLWKGRMQLGTSTNALEMVDSDVFILVDDVVNCTANFNTIEVNNASTIVTWTNVIFKALGTQSPGRLVMNANADMNLDSCQFFDMGAFTLGGTLSEFLNSTWSGCGLITVAGGKINGSNVLNSTVAADASAVNWNVATDPDGYLDNLTISEGSNAHHAIEFGTSAPTSITIRGLDVGSDFASTDSQNNSTFYVARTSGTVTISCVGCSGNMTYKSAGATVVIVSDPVTVSCTVTTADGTLVENARVLITAKDGTGPFPFEETVTIANSGTTATVTHTAHGMATNDYVVISGASLEANNGIFQITYIGVNSYSYTMSSAPGSSPTGTIIATFAALYGLTNASGYLSTTRVYTSDQPIVGTARKGSSTPYWKPGSISGTVDSSDGLPASAVLISDGV